MSEQSARLPTCVIPRHYDLELSPDLGTATFHGRAAVDLEFSEPTARFWCHAAELEISSAAARLDGRTVELSVETDDISERAVFETDGQQLSGSGRLEVEFTGILNDRLRGFYRSTYRDESGAEHTIATTQFQSTDARRAFPCWDEPEFKATFKTTLIVAPELLAISNTAETGREVLDDGRHRVEFAPTMVMSTYLVAFVVGPLEATDPVEVDGVPVRVVHRPGRGDQAGFALEVAGFGLRWLTEYYDMPYPSDKVDLVAIPDFAAGAMENLGCITFREIAVLVDPARATQPELQRVAEIINHELAHMWFGDLVTMRWWEGIWLNEAFATFMEVACTDAFRPEWDIWTSFGRMRAEAFATDALASTRAIEYPVVTPADAEGMFDTITYEKGASIVRMLERYLGAETFRDGVRHYLRRHAYGNTETTDLWDAIEEVSGEPVRSTMDGWIHQGGHPVITARVGEHGLRLEQEHFVLDPAAREDRGWTVPIRARLRENGEAGETRFLLDRERRIYTRTLGDVITTNVDGAGFYRVLPDLATMTQARESTGDDLTAAERHSLVDDLWASVLAGRSSAADFFDLVTADCKTEDDLTVWQAIGTGLGALSRLIDGPAKPRFDREVAELSDPISERLGYEPDGEESDRTRELRATILRLRGIVAERPDAVSIARGLLDSPDASLAAAAVAVVAHHGTADDFGRFRANFETATDPQTEQRHLRALADFPDAELVESILEETLGGVVRAQDGPFVILRALTNRHASGSAWSFITDNWEEINETFPRNSIERMLGGVVALDEPETAAAVATFLGDHPVPQGAKQIEQHLERQRVNVALRARESQRFAEHLESR